MKASITKLATTLPELSKAVEAGLEKLEKYYHPAWNNQYNVIATILHPHFGLHWFYKVLTERGDKAKILFEHVFGQYQARFNTTETAEVPVA
ncbi:hypothetical protein CPB85DRAFT_1441595 [Mucidula mucida]|nr:hypothetical protein CPB85DRAFT_1441595 [Mucidula mucida]